MGLKAHGESATIMATLTVREAAEALGVKPGAVYAAIRVGRLPARRWHGQLLLFPTIYRIQVRFDDAADGPIRPITWESGLPVHSSQYRELTLRLPHGTIVSTDDALGKPIYPDIVVHQPAIPRNLLAIELRKASNSQSLGHDQQKLKAMTDPHVWFAYGFGVLLTLAKSNVGACEVYVGGEIEPALTAWLARCLKETGLGGA